MIIHVVTIKLKEPSQENLNSIVEKVSGLVGKRDVLQSMKVGVDILHSARSYDIALVAHFHNVEDLNTYATHPVHVPVLAYVGSLAQDITAVDFEC